MEEELKSVKGPGAGMAGFYKPISLPENMASTSAEVIASLNEHLVTALQVRNTTNLFEVNDYCFRASNSVIFI